MNENYTNRTENINAATDKSTADFRTGTPRLSPFQRPVLPPSFYPFHCGKKNRKNK